MRRSWIVVPLLFISLAGCIPVFYAYPTVSYVPGLSFGRDHDNVFAFRVDVTDDTPGPGRYEMRNLPISRSGYVGGQGKTSVDGGFDWDLIAGAFTHQTSHTLRVRLYRPGFELIEIRSWQGTQGIQWKDAKGVVAWEKTLDRLLAPSEAAPLTQAAENQFAHLEPGSASSQHQETLRFVAAEYERLATKLDLDDAEAEQACERCRAKAKCLRELADR
jgi:hypothetical protein